MHLEFQKIPPAGKSGNEKKRPQGDSPRPFRQQSGSVGRDRIHENEVFINERPGLPVLRAQNPVPLVFFLVEVQVPLSIIPLK